MCVIGLKHYACGDSSAFARHLQVGYCIQDYCEQVVKAAGKPSPADQRSTVNMGIRMYHTSSLGHVLTSNK